MRIQADKIGSVARNLNLGRSLTLTSEVDAQAGSVIACRVQNDKSQYNQLEDRHGRLSKVQAGDIVVGALGHRNALHGYEGVVPERVTAGDQLQILNLGGVMGQALSYHRDVGMPFQVEVLGQVMVFPEFGSRVGQKASVAAASLPPSQRLPDLPVVYLVGTCMNSGKTAAACSAIRGLSRAEKRVGGCKLTGVSLIRDILNMADHGAEPVRDFTDTGVVTSDATTSAETARRIFSFMAGDVDLLVAETGDGIFGEYGVQAILGDAELMDRNACLILCANDPAGAVGAVENLEREYGLKPAILTGPVTDNGVGRRFIDQRLGIPAINAFSQPDEFGAKVIEVVNAWRSAR